tara:strand:+ start:13 stop:279 length:267 start_codon:yes stop_codon:yes gene_type:complete
MNKEETKVDDLEDRKLISIPKLAKRWDVSRHHIWNEVQRGNIPAIKSGKRWFIGMKFVLGWEEMHDQLAKEKLLLSFAVKPIKEGDSN